jgi:hypothetical protein
MTKLLEQAVAAAERLPEADQEKIGRDLLAHIEKLRALRADLSAGLRSLDAGKRRELDIEEVIRTTRRRDARGRLTICV